MMKAAALVQRLHHLLRTVASWVVVNDGFLYYILDHLAKFIDLYFLVISCSDLNSFYSPLENGFFKGSTFPPNCVL